MKKKVMSVITMVAIVFAMIVPVNAANTTATVNVNDIVNGNFYGMGVEWDPHVEIGISDADWNTLISRMDYLRPSIVRCMVLTEWYLTGFDSNGNPQTNFNSWQMQKAYKVLDYCQSNGISVCWGDWGAPYGLNWADSKWAKATALCVDYLVNTKNYSCIKFYNLGNEPDGSWSGCTDFNNYKAAIGNMKWELDNKQLSSKVKISGPDTYGDVSWIDLASSQLSSQLGNYDTHYYPWAADIANGAVESTMKPKRSVINTSDPNGYSKEFFINEAGLCDGKVNGDQQPNVRNYWYGVSMADYVAQIMRGGMSGAVAWDLDDGMHPNTSTTLKTWGFWNSQGSETGNSWDEALRPWYYTWSLMSRLFPKGSQIVSTTYTSSYGLRVVSMKKPNGSNYDMSFMLVNNSDAAQTVTLQVPGAINQVTLKQYNYFDGDRPVDGNGFPVVKNTLSNISLSSGTSVTLNSKGVIFLTTMYGGTTVSFGGSSTVPIGRTIAIKAKANSMYASSWISDTNSPLQARAASASTWEKFDVVDAGNGYVALKSQANGKYVSAWASDTNAPLQARATSVSTWEKFQWEDTGDGYFGLKAAANNLYVSAWASDANTPLQARSSTLNDWEKFQWQ